MYHPSKGLHVHCVSSGCQLDTATASVRFFTLHSSLFTFHFSLFTHKKKPLCPPRYRWISPGTQKKEEQKALNPPHRDFSECKFITFSPNDKETKPKIAHYIYLPSLHHYYLFFPFPIHPSSIFFISFFISEEPLCPLRYQRIHVRSRRYKSQHPVC